VRAQREREKERELLTTLAALVVTESPQKKYDTQMIHRNTIAPAELLNLPWNAS
jgi:hypothetical protein